ncbi:hypothetical protein [Streptomyces flavofungini]|uniref:hypothetical protein n=1 Tax=Streptomyces flavofungini TaxID=68200 RepID=UPI0025AFF4A7|nr:hypothetical protein [Streptomyces flavofungini]WJV46705.1 hypothetical protein QUY26_14940 [Streptomyces flavofungini]
MVSAVVQPGTAARLVRAAVGRRALRVLVLLAGLVVLGLVCGERARAAEGGDASDVTDAVREVVRPVAEPAVRPARDAVDEAARVAQGASPAEALAASPRTPPQPTRTLPAPTQAQSAPREVPREPKQATKQALPEPRRVLPEPKQALSEPKQALSGGGRVLPGVRRVPVEPRKLLPDAGPLVPKAKALLAGPQRVLPEPRHLLPEPLRPGAGGGGAGATRPGPSDVVGEHGAGDADRPRRDRQDGHGGRGRADVGRGAAAYGPRLDSSYGYGSWTSPYGDGSGGLRGGEVRSGDRAVFGAYGTGGSERAPLPGRPGGCVSGQSAGDGSAQRHADVGAVGSRDRGEVRLVAGPGAAAGAAPVRDRHRDILEFPG